MSHRSKPAFQLAVVGLEAEVGVGLPGQVAGLAEQVEGVPEARAVQIVHSSRLGSRDIEHIGWARVSAQVVTPSANVAR